MGADTPDNREESEAASGRFLFLLPRGFYRELDDLQAKVAPLLITPAAVFRHNLYAVLETARLPYRLIRASVLHRHYSDIRLEELFRLPPVPAGDPEGLRAQALEKARARFREEAPTPEFSADIHTTSRDILRNIHDHDTHTVTGARELLRQVAALTWTAFEVLSRDIFVGVLNSRPSLVNALRADEAVKRLLPLKTVPFETFDVYGFDLSKRMGDILMEDRHLDSLPAIKTAFNTLFRDQPLNDALALDDLWILNQRRHLIVHRRGIVDTEYLTNTREALPLGSELEVTPTDLLQYVGIVRHAGILAFDAATRRLAETGTP